jgi:5-oxoprolinase (ATP-hydrolysing)
MTNHPQCGGSHLPDITVITPVFDKNNANKPIFFTASRGHHADVGGITPGSMPSFSKTLKDEGLAIKSMKIVNKGVFLEDEVTEILTLNSCRVIGDNISDLKAQVSANYKGAELLNELINEYTLPYV